MIGLIAAAFSPGTGGANNDGPSTSWPTSVPPASNNTPCPAHPFAFECTHAACCASYHQRFLLLLASLAIFAFAVLVLVVLLAIEWRPRQWRRGRGGKRMSEVEIKSSEETRYLRRMSELNPNVRREIIE